MIIALMIGRKESKGFPEKNTSLVMGKPLMAYPIITAKNSKYIDEIFISTDSNKVRIIGEKYGAKYIKRPAEFCTDEASGEDAFKHGFEWIKKNVDTNLEFIVLLFCNSPCVTTGLINHGIEILRNNSNIDSAVSVSRYNMWSPLRARKINDHGLLEPFVPFDVIGDPKTLNSNRDSQGDVWFADMGVSIVRPRCFERMEYGLLPQKWMGQRIFPLKQEAGFDIDYKWQFSMLESWIINYWDDSIHQE